MTLIGTGPEFVKTLHQQYAFLAALIARFLVRQSSRPGPRNSILSFDTSDKLCNAFVATRNVQKKIGVWTRDEILSPLSSSYMAMVTNADHRKRRQIQSHFSKVSKAPKSRTGSSVGCKNTGRRGLFCYSLALLCKPYILTHMKDARIQERHRRTIISHRRRARAFVSARVSTKISTHQLSRACDVVVLRYPSRKSTYSELLRKMLSSAVGLHHLHKEKRPIELLCPLCKEPLRELRKMEIITILIITTGRCHLFVYLSALSSFRHPIILIMTIIIITIIIFIAIVTILYRLT